ncbi:unnamed protein product [Adineta ricciae]|uniref:Uncharacterized protein n=1 Tax=Adineta ricciae TaxID=249248 RepID=A0A814GLV3_ADIRI|nr:unnamed protein product [Adineta ricciae]CAF1145614.1 unnamed protein product [Adineta ricciae]
MPVSSGFGYYPYNYPTTKTRRTIPPVAKTQLIARAPKFRPEQRSDPKTTATTTIKTTRNPSNSTRVNIAKRPSLRSDTFLLVKKANEARYKMKKDDTVRQSTQRLPAIRVPAQTTSMPPQKKRVTTIRTITIPQRTPKYAASTTYREDPGPQPVYVPKRQDSPRYPPKRPSVYQLKSPTPAKDTMDISQRVRIGKHDYVVQRKTEDTGYKNTDRQTETIVERPQRTVRILRKSPQQEREDDDDDVYYLKPAPQRRSTVIRKRTPPAGYIRMKKSSSTLDTRRSPRTEVIYLDEDQSASRTESYVYIDEDGNEVKIIDEKDSTPRYVKYAYDDDRGERRSREPKVIYIDKRDKRPSPEPQVIVVKEKEKRPTPESQVIVVKEKEKRPTPEHQVIVVKETEKRPTPEPQIIVVKETAKQRAPEPEVVYVTETDNRRVRQPEVVYVQDQPRPELYYLGEPQEQYVDHSNVVYVDNTHPSSYQPDVIYVEDDQYPPSYQPDVIYVNEPHQRYAHAPEVVYV